MDRNLQLVISKRCPDLLSSPPDNKDDGDWSFTVIRRDDPASEGKSSRFTYLAPVGAEAKANEGGLMHFTSATLPIFPDKKEPYARDATWGTLLKLYEYDALNFKSNSLFDDGLMGRVRLLLPKPALPIRFHECREYKGHSGSLRPALAELASLINPTS